jgi:3-oxoadipate enol-lactonase
VVAIAMHSAACDRCASLILADTFAVHPDGEAIYQRSVQASRHPGMHALAEQRAPLLLAPDSPDDIRSEVIDTMAAIDPGAYRISARAVWLADQRDRAVAIKTPTLVLVGELDPVTPPALSEELASQIPNARLRVIAGASHIANLDKPEEFNRAVECFLHEVEAQG